MKQNNLLRTKALAAASIAALAIGLVLAGCDIFMQKVEETGSIANPDVTTEALSGGVKLSWPPIIEAGSYQVWRKDGAAEYAVNLNAHPLRDSATGKYVYLDLVGSTNPLTAETEYTYTVIAVALAGTQNNGKWTGKVTTTTIPARGDKVAKPSAVAFTILDTGVEVTISPGTDGPTPANYGVALYRKTASGGWGYFTTSYIDGTSGKINAAGLSDGDYAVWANGRPGSDYYSNSDVVKSEPKPYSVLLSSSSYPSISSNLISPISTAGGRLRTLTGYEVTISLISITFKAGVSYSVERATVDENGVVGAYAEVTLKRPNSAYPINFADFVPGFLGHPASTPQGIDTLPTTVRTYQYRIKAVKDGVAVYGTDSYYSRVTIDHPRQQIQGTIEVTATAISGTSRKYQVTPSITSYKNALQSGDKLVVYWIKSPYGDGYQTGPWVASQKLEFTNAELEADAPTGKELSIPYTAGNYVFAEAYLEYADGTRADVRFNYYDNGGFNWNTSGGAFATGAFANGSSYEVYSNGNSVYHYYVQLLYSAPLTAGTWANGTPLVTTDTYVVNTYTLSVTSGTTYYFWVNDFYGGDNSKTGAVNVNASYANGDSVFYLY